MNCPLCKSDKTVDFHSDKIRTYILCHQCDLVFVHPNNLPAPNDEKERYELHQNKKNDEGYTSFLARMIPLLKEIVQPPAKGLDFGCGPSPIYAGMLGVEGYNMHVYDPFFMPDKHTFRNQYQFITITEVVEHFHEPGTMFTRLIDLLLAKGVLAVMTQLRTADTDFPNWYYKNDFTHTSFYSQTTFHWIANNFNLEYRITLPDIVILKKKN